jgi:AraC-like DNA-binding protein
MPRTTYREWADPGRAPVVRCWWEQRVPAGADDYVQRVVPDGCADIIVDGDGAVFVGPTTAVDMPRLRAGTHVRGLRFRTEALGPALRHPAGDLRGVTIGLEQVLTDRQTRHVVDQIGLGRLPELFARPAVDGRVRAAVRRLSTMPASSTVRVADDLGLSSRHLRRLLIEHTGLGPSSIQRVARLHTFLRMAGGQWPRPGLAELAADAGYADQSHLSRDVRDLTATTPATLLAERLGS